MKNSKIAKIVAIALSVLLIVGVSVMISATADDAQMGPVVKSEGFGIASLNLSYGAQTEMAFAVYDGLEPVAEGGSREFFLLFFSSDPDTSDLGELSADKLYERATARKESSGTVKIDGVSHLLFYSNGLMARELANDIYVCPIAIEKLPTADGEGYTYNYIRGYTEKVLAEDGVTATYNHTARICNPVAYARQKVLEISARLAEIEALYETELTATEKRTLEIEEINISKTLTLCSSIISYASASIEKLGGTLDFDKVLIVNGGSMDVTKDGIKSISVNVNDYPADATVLLRAEAKNAEGQYFLYWEDVNGNVVCTERVFANAPVHNDLGYTVYTAVYGSASESAYANTLDLENLVTKDNDGNYVAVNPDRLVEQVEATSATTSRITRSFYNSTTYTKVMDLVNNCHFVADSSSSTGFSLSGETLMTLVDDSYGSGDKNLKIESTSTSASFYETIFNQSTGSNAAELDLQINEVIATAAGGNFTRLQFVGYGPSGAQAYRFDVSIAVSGNETDGYVLKVGSVAVGTVAVYNETTDPGATPVTDASAVQGYKLSSLNEIVTIKCVIDDSGTVPSATVSVNGTQVFCGNATKNAYNYGYFATFTSAKYTANSTYIYSFREYYYSGAKGALTLDNITFFDEQ